MLRESGRNRLEKYFDPGSRLPEGGRRTVQLRLYGESPPLNFLLLIFRKGRLENRQVLSDRRLPIRKGLFDRFGQNFAIKIELVAEHPDVVKILHATVQITKVHHGPELFSNGALLAVAVQPGRGEIKKRGKRFPARTRYDDVTETNIHLEGNACVSKVPTKPNADALVLRVLRV